MDGRLFTFYGSAVGPWRVTRMTAVSGSPIPAASRVGIVSGHASPKAAWTLRGMISNERYVNREEKNALVARQEGLGRSESTCAALISIRKNSAWWGLTQDERRAIFEQKAPISRRG